MKRFVTTLALLLVHGALIAQNVLTNPTATQTVTQPSGTSLNINTTNGVRNAILFAGGDIGAQVNNAFTDCSNSCTVQIPAGTYPQTTTILMTSPGQSLVGLGGSTATTLSYSGSGDSIKFQTNGQYGGSIRGLTITGTTAAGSGIHTGSTLASKLDDLTLNGFTGSMGKCLYIENTGANGQQYYYERNTLTNVQLLGCTYGMYVTNTSGTDSLGYNHFYSVDTQPFAGQYGIYVNSGIYWYNGELINHCNSGGGECIHLQNGANLTGILLSLTGELQGTTSPAPAGIDLEAGANLYGCGNVSTFSVLDSNTPGGGSATTSPSFFVGSCTTAPTWGGTVADWDGAGHAANLIPIAVAGAQLPFGLGFARGTLTDINSLFVNIYQGATTNRFAVRTTGSDQAWSLGHDVWSVDSGGNTIQLGAVNASAVNVSAVNASNVVALTSTFGQTASAPGAALWVHEAPGLNITSNNYTGISAAVLSAVNDTATAFSPISIRGATVDINSSDASGAAGPITVKGYVALSQTLNVAGGATVGGTFNAAADANVSTTLRAASIQANHYLSSGSSPTVAALGGAGTGATVSLSSNATDSSGFVTLTLGTSPPAGPAFQITFSVPYATTPKCWLIPSSSGPATGQLAAYIAPSGTSATSVTAKLANIGSGVSGPNSWVYKCEQ